MIVKCLESFNKIYNEQLTLKEKQQGKGFDEKSYNRKDMIEVLEMERKNKELLNNANKKVDNLNDKSINITTLLNELEPAKKNNCINSKDGIDYITEYIKETKEATPTIKNINSLDSSSKKVDRYLNEYDTNKEDLVFENIQKDKIIYSLNRDLNVATKTIYTLKDKIKTLQEEIFKFKSFFKRITGYFRSKILFKHDKEASMLLDDMKATNTISTNEYEHIVYGKKLDIEDKNKDKKEYLR